MRIKFFLLKIYFYPINSFLIEKDIKDKKKRQNNKQYLEYEKKTMTVFHIYHFISGKYKQKQKSNS